MSFGYGIGDIVTVGQLAWTVYKGCRDAPESFRNLSQEILSLHAVLKEVEECLPSDGLAPSKQLRLKNVTQGCSKVLEDLQDLVDRYRGLGTQKRRTWDRVKFASEQTVELRSRLTSNTVLLAAYLSTCQVVVEKTLNDYLRDFQTSRHDGSLISIDTVRSIVSTHTTQSISLDDQKTWRTIRKDLEDMGISVAAFDANKTFILDWFKTAIDNGSFDQEASYECLSNTAEVAAFGETSGNLADNVYPRYTASDLGVSTHDTSSNTSHKKDDSNSLPMVTTSENVGSSSSDILTQHSRLVSDQEDVSQVRSRPLPIPARQKRSQNQPTQGVGFTRHRKKLREAVELNDEARVRVLLNQGVDLNMKSNDGWVPLIHAVQHGHIALTELLLENGANARVVDKHDNPVLHHAICYNQKHTLRLLLSYGADINAKDSDHNTGLHLAVSNNNITILQLLLESGAYTHIQNKPSGETALHIASAMEDEELTLLLINHGAAVSIKNNRAETALDFLISRRDKHLIQQLLNNQKNRIDVNDMDTHNRTFLSEALLVNDFEFAQLLFTNGAVVRVEDLIEILRRKGDLVMNEDLQLLLDHCSDINLRDRYQHTALYCAVESGTNEAVRLLLQHGADVGLEYDVPNNRPNYTALNLFQKYQDAESQGPVESILELAFATWNRGAVQLLFEFGMPARVKDKCLQAAIIASDSRAVQILLQSGADPNMVSQQPGNICHMYHTLDGTDCEEHYHVKHESLGSIHRAACIGDLHIMQLLLDSRADIDLKTGKNIFAANWTALHCAIAKRHLPIVLLLLEKGASTRLWDDYHRTPYDLAQQAVAIYKAKGPGHITKSGEVILRKIVKALTAAGAQSFDEIPR